MPRTGGLSANGLVGLSIGPGMRKPQPPGAGVDGRSVNRLFTFVSRRPGHNVQPDSRFHRRGTPSYSPAENEIVPVDHFGAAGVAENQQHVGGRSAFDFFGVFSVISDEPAADFMAVRSAHDDRVAAPESRPRP